MRILICEIRGGVFFGPDLRPKPCKTEPGYAKTKICSRNNDGISLGANDLGALRNLRWPPPPFIFSDFSPFTDVQNPGITMILLKTLEL